MTFKRVFHFTHSDLDGVACAVVTKVLLEQKTNVTFCNYDRIDEILTKFLEREDITKEDLLLITDICPSKEVCEKLSKERKRINVKLVDHHVTKKWASKFVWVVFDTRHCGAFLTARAFSKVGNENLKDFLSSVEAWDLWKTEDKYRERGENLNTLQAFMGLDEFMKEFSEDLNADLNKEYLKKILEFLIKEKKRTIKRTISEQLRKNEPKLDAFGNSFKILFASDYISETAHAALEDEDSGDLKYVVIIDPVKNSCSFRSKDESVDVGEIAKSLGGGGHKTAAGFVYNFRKKISSIIHNLILSKN
jgi:oligoribonuclease NrnB/cAMP/cGMP phosphodiesterase (DHH superfamily)